MLFENILCTTSYYSTSYYHCQALEQSTMLDEDMSAVEGTGKTTNRQKRTRGWAGKQVLFEDVFYGQPLVV